MNAGSERIDRDALLCALVLAPTTFARNRFFGAHYFDFSTPPRAMYARYLFFSREASAAQFWRGMLIAAVISFAMAWVGLHAGRAMQRVRR